MATLRDRASDLAARSVPRGGALTRPWAALIFVCFVVPATLDRVVDGDTFVADLHVFHDERRHVRVRLPVVNTPELPTPEGLAAKEFTEAWLRAGPFHVRSCGFDKYGRVLGNAMRTDDDLVSALVKHGHAQKAAKP